MLKENAEYTLAAEHDRYRVYIPVNTSDYHITRVIEAMKYNTYAAAGITEEFLKQAMDEIISRCNKREGIETVKTDIAAIANAVIYCTKYPVDQHCAVRMGACLSFLEFVTEDNTVQSEDPNKPDIFFQQKKERLAMDYPEMYSFFLSWGIANTEKYRESSEVLNDSAYFQKRAQAIASLLPPGSRLFRGE